MSGTTPLPPRPSLEFERKRAKKLLRELRRGDPGARVTLADAQFTIARGYGFASWPRLVEYFATWERHERSGPMFQSRLRGSYEQQVRDIVDGHRRERTFAARKLATFVPRFYGRSDAEIFATPVTEDDARLAVARTERFSSWPALVDSAPETLPSSSPEAMLDALYGARFMEAFAAAKAHDLASLARLVDAHPELLRTPSPEEPGDSLLRNALLMEERTRSPEARAVTDWLVSRGADLTGTLSRMLTQCLRASTTQVAYFLDRGADPAWMPPNGISVLEHALIRYWNPEAVDLIARRVTPRKAFWIAAGLGDVRGVLAYLDRDGRPRPAARRDRPDCTAVGLSTPCRPNAGDHEIVWEAFCVAGFNQRFAVLDALLDRGFPVDAAPWGMSLMYWAHGNQIAPLVEHLEKRGARRPDP
jgi:hypothetical protein